MSHTFVGSQNSNLSLLCDLKIESIHPMQQPQQHPAHQHGKVERIFFLSLLNFAHTRL